jgi:hypothetical protein
LTRDPFNPGLELGRVKKKLGKGKTWGDPVTWQDQVKKWFPPVEFFLLKRRRFDLKKRN